MKWTWPELSNLKKLCKKHTLAELSKILGRLPGEINSQLKRQGWRARPPKPQTFKELAVIANHYETHGLEATMLNYNLTVTGVSEIVEKFKKAVKEYSASLLPDDIRKIRTRAMKVAASKNYHHHAEDFASYCVYKKITLQHDKLSYDYLWMNYAQNTFGDWGTENGRAKVLGEQGALEIVERYPEEGQVILRGEDGREEKVNFRILADRYGLKKDDERIIFILYFRWGFNHADIAELYGVSESRICQRMSVIFTKIRYQLE